MKKKIFPLLIFLLWVFVLGFWIKASADVTWQNQIVFCNVGQGDGILITTSESRKVVVDGGPDKSILLCLGEHFPWLEREVDLLIITHTDSDHIAGAIQILKRYKVKEILFSGALSSSSIFEDFLKALESEQKEGAKLEIATSGKVLEMGSLKILVLFPQENYFKKLPSSNHQAMVVFKVELSGSTALFTGDLEKKEAEELAELAPNNLSASLLKVPHHGSKNSLSENFYKLVAPRIAIISVGKDNRYGHPAKEVLSYLKEHKIEIWRTDENGEIICLPSALTWRCSSSVH